MKLLTCLVFLFWLTGCASLFSSKGPIDPKKNSGTAAITQISPLLLLEDLALIKQKLLNIHPQPFARISKDKFEQQYHLIQQTLNYPLSRSEFYLRIAPLLASMRDVHSYVHLPKDQQGHFKYRDEKLFPLAVVVQDNMVFVAADLSQNPIIQSGAQLQSINKAPITFLLNFMKTLTTKETETGQQRKIQMSFAWLLSAMGYGGEIFDVEYLWQGELFTVQLDGLSLLNNQSTEVSSYYGVSKLNQSTSLFWLNDFNEKSETFDAYLTEQFERMERQNVKNLILDLRFNSGGITENLKNLLSRMIDEPITWAENGVIKVSAELKKHHKRKTRKRRKDKYNWGLSWLPLEWADQLQHSIWWASPGDMISLELNEISPRGAYKPPNIWVLTNGYCYSACSFFVASVNRHQLGKTIGEKPGSLANFQFAYPVSFSLPHSGLVITFPTIKLEFSATEQADFIQPQEVINRTQQDIIQRRDPLMLKALTEAKPL